MNPDLERLVGRAVTDKAFRDKLLADPEATIQDAGLKLSDEELARLKATIQKADAEQLDQQLIGITGHW
jgi:hypothetical protein